MRYTLKLARIAWWSLLIGIVTLLMRLRAGFRTRASISLILVVVSVGVVEHRYGAPASPVLGTIRVGAGPVVMAVDARSGHAFFSSGLGTISMVDTKTGALLTTTRVGLIPAAIAVDTRTSRVFVINDSVHTLQFGSTVSLLDAHTGHLLRTIPVDGFPYGIAVDEEGGRVFVLNVNSMGIQVFDARSGRLLSTIATANGAPYLDPRALIVDGREGRALAILGTSAGYRLGVIDTRRSALLHLIRVGDNTFVPPGPLAVDPSTGQSFVLSAKGLTFLDMRSGRILRTVSGQYSEMVVDARHNRIFVAGPHSISILDGRTGTVLRRFSLGNTYLTPLAVDEETGRVLLAAGCSCEKKYQSTGNNTIYIIKGNSGAVVRTIVVRGDPAAAVVDERTGHAFVANGTTGTITVLDTRI